MLIMKNKLILLVLFFIGGCAVNPIVTDSAPDNVPINVMAVADAVPRHEKRTRAGNPDQYEIRGKRYIVLAESKGFRQRGMASWYGTKFHGKKTANGEIYDMYAMTAAHKTLPIPSYVRVTHLKNQRSVVVRVNDRGPFHSNRIIDLSYTAAVKLGMQQTGTGFVEIVAVEPEDSQQNEIKNNLAKANIGEKLYLQIGAFNNPFNARQLQKKLSSIHITDSRLKISQSQGEDALYKVQIGPLTSKKKAAEITTRLAVIGVTATKLLSED